VSIVAVGINEARQGRIHIAAPRPTGTGDGYSGVTRRSRDSSHENACPSCPSWPFWSSWPSWQQIAPELSLPPVEALLLHLDLGDPLGTWHENGRSHIRMGQTERQRWQLTRLTRSERV